MPIESGQQMYQALRSLAIDTQMVIYPQRESRYQPAELCEGSL